MGLQQATVLDLAFCISRNSSLELKANMSINLNTADQMF